MQNSRNLLYRNLFRRNLFRRNLFRRNSFRVGILGFGVVGKSALIFFKKFVSIKLYKNFKITIWDQRSLSSSELEMLKKYGVQNHVSLSLDSFFKSNDKLFVSPGFNPSYFKKIDKDKILCELDLFSEFYKKPVVAITGSLGKTTITSFLNELAQKISLKSVAGGNIGNALLNLITKQVSTNIAFTELSSFQLKFNKNFAPKIAVFNNFYSNHLNWHKDLKDYFESKCKIFEYQNREQFVVFPICFLNGSLPVQLKQLFLKKLKKTKSKICFVGQDLEKDFKSIKSNNLDDVFLFSKTLNVSTNVSTLACSTKPSWRRVGGASEEKNSFIFYKILNNKVVHREEILDLNILPKISFEENWLFIISILFLLKQNMLFLKKLLVNFSTSNFTEHRLELFLTNNNIDFYNDSKSTVFQATIQALKKISKNKRPVILILGGLSKGVDRAPLLEYLNQVENLKKVLCFGADCKSFSYFKSYSSLEGVINVIFDIVKPGDQVLFSPSGSSFDLFKSYQHRGECFKELILKKFNSEVYNSKD